MTDRENPLFDNQIDEILTVPELAVRLKMSCSGIRKQVALNKIPHFRIGTNVRFNWGEVISFLTGKQ